MDINNNYPVAIGVRIILDEKYLCELKSTLCTLPEGFAPTFETLEPVGDAKPIAIKIKGRFYLPDNCTDRDKERFNHNQRLSKWLYENIRSEWFEQTS